MTVKMELHGFKELNKALKDLPKNVENRVLQRSVTGAMRSVLKDFKAAAPVHLDAQSPASKKYGTLKKNIRVSNRKRKQKNSRTSTVHTGDAFWGYIYEKGSRRQPARPWFLPTFSRLSESVLKVLRERLGKGIEDEFKKGLR